MVEFNYILNEFWDEHANPMFNHVFPGGPMTILTIIGIYLAFVLKYGPQWMKERKPFEIQSIIQCYNLINIVINLMMFVLIAYHTNMTMKCWDCNYEPSDNELSQVPFVAHVFLSLKVSFNTYLQTYHRIPFSTLICSTRYSLCYEKINDRLLHFMLFVSI